MWVGLCLLSIPAYAIVLGIVTGSEYGTYYRIGQDIRTLLQARDPGIDLRVYASKGSLENVYDMSQKKGVQLGIVQNDVLTFLHSSSEEQQFKRLIGKIKMVFPLYEEEVHIVARSDSGIETFSDLDGKRVAIGQDTEGTFLTASVMLKLAHVYPAEKLSIGTDEALKSLIAGHVDAMFYVAGYPIRLFEKVAPDAKIKLVPVTEKDLNRVYLTSRIPGRVYAWQNDEVPTVAVKAVLVSFDFQGANCLLVGQVAKLIYDNMKWLRQNGHPKWQDVNPNLPVPGWEQYRCVARALERSF
jgi:TRAP transporter TAXI family solute receptor